MNINGADIHNSAPEDSVGISLQELVALISSHRASAADIVDSTISGCLAIDAIALQNSELYLILRLLFFYLQVKNLLIWIFKLQ